MRTTTIVTFIALLIMMLPICHAAELNLQFSANGNLITGDGKYRVYNGLNQLWKIYNGSSTAGPLLEEYTYHPLEERILVKKVYATNGSLAETVYYFSEEKVWIVNNSGTYNYRYIYHEGSLIAQEVNGVRHYISGNHEGSSSVVSSVNQSVVESTEYSPFGEILSGGQASRFGYEGQEYSSVTGDMDFHFRKYNPSWGLFLQPDSLIPNVFNPQTLNHYAFERNSPTRYTDPTGHMDPITFVIGIIGLFMGASLILYTLSGSGNGIDDDLYSSAPYYPSNNIPSSESGSLQPNTMNAATPNESAVLAKLRNKQKLDNEDTDSQEELAKKKKEKESLISQVPATSEQPSTSSQGQSAKIQTSPSPKNPSATTNLAVVKPTSTTPTSTKASTVVSSSSSGGASVNSRGHLQYSSNAAAVAAIYGTKKSKSKSKT